MVFIGILYHEKKKSEFIIGKLYHRIPNPVASSTTLSDQMFGHQSIGEIKLGSTLQGTMEDAAKCLREREKWIGKLVEIKYNGLTAYNVPQYAQMNYLNCVKGDR